MINDPKIWGTLKKKKSSPGIKFGKTDGGPGLRFLERLWGIDQIDDEMKIHWVKVIFFHSDQSHKLVLGNDEGKHQVLEAHDIHMLFHSFKIRTWF